MKIYKWKTVKNRIMAVVLIFACLFSCLSGYRTDSVLAAVKVKEVQRVSVQTLKGHSPSLPACVDVSYTDGTREKTGVVWPTEINPQQYASAGTFSVEGRLFGEEDVAVTADVTVTEDKGETKEAVAQNFDLSDITLDEIGEDGSILTQNRDRDIAYLKLLDKDRMLYNFYKNYSETDKIRDLEPLGGWDEPAGLLRGHSTGRYMSALALAYSSTQDEELKDDLDYVVHELSRMQDKSSGDAAAFTSKGTDQSVWSTDPSEWGTGYISAYPPDQFALLEKYTEYGQIWAPYYTLHKLLAGFLDAYTYTGNEEALQAAEKLGKWVCVRLGACSQKQLTKMWDMYVAGEFGGCNESLAQLYLYTGDETFLDGAKLFDNTNFFAKLERNVDDIAGRHAAQHIPQVIGALEIYAATQQKGEPEVRYYDIAQNFWQMAVSRYASSVGGVGASEKFTEAYRQANSISGNTNNETCASYNMLKLTKMLNNYNPDDASYMDYYERTLYNHILASQTPNVTDTMHNGTTFTMPIGPGSVRSYGGDYDSFTCCHGTGMENHVRYQEAAYVRTDDTLYVGLYLPSTVTWKEKGITVKQETDYPSEDTTLTVAAAPGSTSQESFSMKLRVPYWAVAGFTVTVNGKTKMTEAEPCSYVELKEIHAGDEIKIHMPWTFHLDQTPDTLDGAEVASIMYGPFVMAAQINSTDWKTLVLSENPADCVQISEEEETGFPQLLINGYWFAPMFDEQFAVKPYHTYFKILITDDPDSNWYEADMENTTPENGSFTLDQDMVREGDSVTVTAVPKDGYMVRMLTVNGVELSPDEENVYTIPDVHEDIRIEGSFRRANLPEPDPAHLEYSAAVSSDFTASWEKLDGISADWEPEQSAAGTGKGWGNWPQSAGSEHYVQYEWEKAVTMNRFDIYWYDDNGDTAIPGSIKIMYKNTDGSWKEARMISDYKDVIAKDQYNTITFKPVTATAVKLVLTVHDGKAANGILRWKVSDTGKNGTDSTEPAAQAASSGKKDGLWQKILGFIRMVTKALSGK